jgi:hypothetical protein
MNTLKPLLVLLASLSFAIAPFLSPEFGGFDPERYPNPQRNPPVQPAGWAFAIWGLIYLALITHAAFGFLRHKHNPAWDAGRIPLLISLIVGTAWLPIALVSPIWATILIWIMLLSALFALDKMRSATPPWIALWPVALYAGWLSAASFVSIGLLLAGYGITAEVPAAIISLLAATSFALAVILRQRHWPYAAAAAWGFLGIAAANYPTNMLLAALASLAAIGLITLVFRTSR